MVCAVRRRHFWLGLCVVCYTLMPFAPYLITANPDLPYRILDYWALWIGFAAAAVFVLLTQNMKRPRAREIAKYAALALCGLCMIRQSYAMTRVFYTDYRKYQQDVSTMPVSYTHLDVYKRQTLTRTASRSPDGRRSRGRHTTSMRTATWRPANGWTANTLRRRVL